MPLDEAEQALFRSSMISLAADREEVRKIALSLEAFELGTLDPTTEIDMEDANREMSGEFGLDYAGSVAAVQLAYWRHTQERRANNEQT